MVEPVIGQRPLAHVFYDIEWCKWLEARGFIAANIVSVTWTVEAPLVKTFDQVIGSISRVWIKGVPNDNKTREVTATINMPEPSVGVGNVQDSFTFGVRAIDK